MLNEVSITAFRTHSGPLFTDVVQRHQPRIIRRGMHDAGVLIGVDEALSLLTDREFTPQVMRGDEGVAIWLPEFDIYGEGETYAQAKEELLGEVRHYVEEYLGSLDEHRHAPNRAAHFPHVLRAGLAEVRGELASVIFPGPPSPSAVHEQPVAAA